MSNTTFDRAARQAAPWIERLARLGYASKGFVYATAGSLSAAAALRHRDHAADRNETLTFIFRQPFGRVVLLLVAVGLAGYAFWRIVCGLFDTDRRGRDAKAIAIRLGSAIRGFAYGFVAIEVALFATGRGSAGRSSDSSVRHWTARALAAPAGRWAVGLAGLIVIGAACYQIARAFKKRLSRRLPPSRIDRRIVRICRFGIAARGVVFLVVGGSLVGAALAHDAASARGTAGAMSMLGAQPFGRFLLMTAAIGLLAYGVYGFINARYRRINAT